MKVKTKDFIFVSLQFLLFLIYTIDSQWFFGFTHPIKYIGLVFAFLGFLIIILAILQLNKNLSPFPTPKNNSLLIQNGLYKIVRHPIYSGIMLLFLGYGIYKDSVFKLFITALLFILFYLKTNYEEKLLQNKFPEYALYKKKVGRFFIKF